jgi:hypothetical protein
MGALNRITEARDFSWMDSTEMLGSPADGIYAGVIKMLLLVIIKMLLLSTDLPLDGIYSEATMMLD